MAYIKKYAAKVCVYDTIYITLCRQYMYFLGALTVVIRHDDGAPTVGQSLNLTCTVILDGITGPPAIEWLGPNNNTVVNSSSVTGEHSDGE